MQTEPTAPTLGSLVICAVGIAAALSGCTSKTMIQPDQLPLVTEAAETASKAPVEVRDPNGDIIKLRGRLDAVVVLTHDAWGNQNDRYEAPIMAQIAGRSMTVRSHDLTRDYSIESILGVEVEHYNTTAVAGIGAALTALGLLVTVSGTVLIAIVGRPEVSGIGLVIGLPVVVGGIGITAGGITLLVAGARKPARFSPGSSARGTPAVVVGSGGLRVQF